VDDLEAVARRLVAACGLEWEPACLEFHRHERPIRTASVTQVRQPVYKQSVARWKNYEPALAELFAELPNVGPSPLGGPLAYAGCPPPKGRTPKGRGRRSAALAGSGRV